jgi:hypothetical protein
MLNCGTRLSRLGGVFVLAGYSSGCSAPVQPNLVHERNIPTRGAGDNAGFNEVAALAAGHELIRTEPMITHRFRLDEDRTVFRSDLVPAPEFVNAIFSFAQDGIEDDPSIRSLFCSACRLCLSQIPT